MGSWNQLLSAFALVPDEKKGPWLDDGIRNALSSVGALRGDRHVVLYGSAFLQKPEAPPSSLLITHEDLNGFMAIIYGMDWSKGLTLILHTPGGVPNAAESIVAYLRSKFADVEVVVPTLCMSAGTMIALSTHRIVMGRQSQLGPIDPQMGLGSGRSVSAQAVVNQFERAKSEVLSNQALAHVWAPIVQSLGPSALQEAQDALDYSETMVAKWLSDRMFDGESDSAVKGAQVAHYFNDATTHKSHGRRIDRDEARSQGLRVEDLEDDQDLQEAVLTAYHLFTLIAENSPVSKVLASDTGNRWLKNWLTAEQQEAFLKQQAAGGAKPGGAGAPIGANRQQRRQQQRKR